MTWKDLLARKADLIGGVIQVRNQSGIFRARITAIDDSEPTVHFKTSGTFKETPGEKGSKWVLCDLPIIFRYSTKVSLVGDLPPGRIQIDNKPDWAIIYAKEDPIARG